MQGLFVDKGSVLICTGSRSGDPVLKISVRSRNTCFQGREGEGSMRNSIRNTDDHFSKCRHRIDIYVYQAPYTMYMYIVSQSASQ